MNIGSFYGAALLASMAFETAILEAAKKLKLEVDDRPQPSRLIAKISSRLEDPLLEERLRVLVRLRNSIVHAPDRAETIERYASETALRAFGSGIDLLQRALTK